MGILGAIIKIKYCFIHEVKLFGINDDKAFVVLATNKQWHTIPAALGKINLKSTPQTEGDTLVYTTEGTVNIPHSRYQNLLTNLSGKKIIIKVTLVDNTELIYGDKLNPILAIQEKVTPSTPVGFAGTIIKFIGKDTHGALKSQYVQPK